MKVLDFQYIEGSDEAYRNISTVPASATPLTIDSAGTIPMRFTYTPAVDAWWELTLNVGIFQNATATYSYMYAQINVAPIPGFPTMSNATGGNNAFALESQAGPVPNMRQYANRVINKVFRLSAGVPQRRSKVIHKP
jgi:hypothetical protein